MTKKKNSLNLFKNDLKYINILNETEINDYIKKAQQGDNNARNRVVESNIELVMKIANMYSKNEDNYLELIQVGITGLYEAVEKYNFGEAKFSSYAVYRVKKNILQEIYKNSNIFNSSKFTYYLNKYNKLIQSNTKINDKELCKELDVSKKKLALIKEYSKVSFISGNEQIYNDSDKECDLFSTIEDKNDYYEKLNINIDFKLFLAMAKYILTKIEYYVIYNKALNKNLIKIGEPINIDNSRTHKIYLTAINKLKSVLNDENEYLEIINKISLEYNDIYKLNLNCSGVLEVCKYLYLKNKLSEDELKLLYEIWFTLKPINAIYKDNKEKIKRIKSELNNIDDNDFNNYKNKLINEFGTKVFKLVDVNLKGYDEKKKQPVYIKEYIKKYY